MAVIYLRSSDGDDASDGLTWANAKATMAAAVTAAGAGGTVYVSASHSETAASTKTITGPAIATDIAHCKVYSVDDTGNPEPPTALSSGAAVQVTSNSEIILAGGLFFYGVVFDLNTSSAKTIRLNHNTYGDITCESCTFNLSSAFASVLDVGTGSASQGTRTRLLNCVIIFSHTGCRVRLMGECEIIVCSFSGTVATGLFYAVPVTGNSGTMRIVGCDLSTYGSGKTLIDVTSSDGIGHILFEGCKIDDAVTLVTGIPDADILYDVRFVNCAGSDINYNYALHTYNATITDETTVVRTGGATDGTTTFSRKIVTTAKPTFYFPAKLDPIVMWVDDVGSSVSATIEFVTDGVTLTNQDIWMELEYLGTSGVPRIAQDTSRSSSLLATAVNCTSSSATWTTTGLSSPVKQKIAITFTPREKGVITGKVYVGKASTTVYVDPLLTVG